MAIVFRRGRIFFPVNRSAPLWKVRITRTNGDIYTIADTGTAGDEALMGRVTRRSTDGLSDFLFTFLSKNRKYLDPAGNAGCLFDEDDVFDVFATYESPLVENDHHIFRGFVDNAYMAQADAAIVEIEGRDYPIIASDDTITKTFVGANILDVFIDRTDPTGEVDDEGNAEGSVLYGTGLTLQYYDHFTANDWVVVKDLSDADFETLKDNIVNELTAEISLNTITNSYENKKHIFIAKDTTVTLNHVWYIHFDYPNKKWYFRLHREGKIKNEVEYVVKNQNWLSGPSRFGKNNDDVVKEVVAYGRTTGSIPIIRSARDTSYSGTRAKRKTFNDAGLDTSQLVQQKADALLANLKNVPIIMDNVSCLGALTLKPGEKIDMSNDDMGVSSDFIIPEFDFIFNEGGNLDSNLRIKVIQETLAKQQNETDLANRFISPFFNLESMNNSINFDFRSGEEDTLYTLSGMQIVNEVLSLSDPNVDGTLSITTNDIFTFTDNIVKVLLRVEGSLLDNTTFDVTADAGVSTPQVIEPGVVTPITTTGKNLTFNVNASGVSGVSPQFNRIGLLIFTSPS